MNQRESLSYRADIDGLRAIAVIGVILYHARITPPGGIWLQGGYVGVDVFFVISGYLIGRILFTELDRTGAIDLPRFYERRARRILPVLLVVMLAGFPVAWFSLQPSDLVEFCASALSALGFVSNFFFYFATTEYGAQSSLLKPLLHTWSLAVEEQFYLVFPLLVWIVFRLPRVGPAIPLIMLSLVSLQLAQTMEFRNSELNFYFPLSRFWELAAGGLLAIRERGRGGPAPARLAGPLALLGLVMVAGSMVFFDAATPHPGYRTLLPVLGVALVIGSGSRAGLAARLLGCRPMVWVGLVSYSAYLWHFPLFAFTRLHLGEPGMAISTAIIGLTFVLSALSYRFVETPFRDRVGMPTRRFIRLLALGCAVPLAMSVWGIVLEGHGRQTSRTVAFANFEPDNRKLRDESWGILNQRLQNNPRFDAVANRVLIVGNSHAKDVFNMLYLNREKYPGFDFLRGPVSELACLDEDIAESEPAREAFYQSESYRSATLIIVSSRYGERRCNRHNEHQSRSDDLVGLGFLIRRAAADGKPLIVMGRSPEFRRLKTQWVVDSIYQHYRDDADADFGHIRAEADRLLYRRLEDGVTRYNERVRTLARENGVVYFDRFSTVCRRETRSCDGFTDDGYKTLYDYGHHTIQGARFFGERLFREGFTEVMLRSSVPGEKTH